MHHISHKNGYHLRNNNLEVFSSILPHYIEEHLTRKFDENYLWIIYHVGNLKIVNDNGTLPVISCRRYKCI